jgi:hypothetical protein
MGTLGSTLRRWLDIARAWSPAFVPLAILCALVLAYSTLRLMIDDAQPVDVVARGRLEVAKIAWAACQLVIFSALGWHIVLHAVLLRDAAAGLRVGAIRALWALVLAVAIGAAFYFFRSRGAVSLMATLLGEIERAIPSVRYALDLGNTMAVTAVALLAAWGFVLLRPRAQRPEKALASALGRTFLLSLNSSAALLVIALAQIWVLNLVPSAVAEVLDRNPQHAAAYREAANGVVLAAGICFSAVLVLVYLPLLAMLRARNRIDDAALTGTLVSTARTVAPILAPAVSGLLAGLPLLVRAAGGP